MISVIIFFLILGLLVLIHEFGHFIAAKKNGVQVEEFGIGFPPRALSKKIGDTIYSLNWIPLGGFVRLHGEEYAGSAEGDSKAFVYKHPLRKTIIVCGGVIMNLLLGICIYYGILTYNGFVSDPMPLLFSHKFAFGKQEGRVIASHLVKGSPAEKAGLKAENVIVGYKKSEDTSWTKLVSAKQLIDLIKQSDKKQIELETQHLKTGKKQYVQVTPQYNPTLKRAVIGVNLLDGVVIYYQEPQEKLLSGILHSYNILSYNASAIKELVMLAVRERSTMPVAGAVSGPVGIYSVVNDVVQTSGEQIIKNLLNITALLSLSLAFMNILPLPALDGGRQVFVLYEWITKKRVNKKIEAYTNFVGFVSLICLAIVISISDILKLLR